MLSQHSIASNMKEAASEAALKIIADGDALAKTICSPVSDNQSWDEILPKLAITQGDEKGSSPHTETTATTLLPVDGKIYLFEPSNPKYQVMVGMLFDLKKCDIQYIFQKNAFSKDWLNKGGSSIPPQLTLEQLKNINSQARKEGIILEHNEILAGLSADSLVAVFSTKNDLLSRLNALAKQHLIKRTLNKIVPVLIITPQDGAMLYDPQQQMCDIQNALSKDINDPVRILVDNDIDTNLNESPTADRIMQNLTINVATVSNIIRTETHDPAIIERAIIQLCHINPQGAGQVFSDYLYQVGMPNPAIISAFIQHCPILETRSRPKRVAYIEANDYAWEHNDPEVVVNMKQWSSLVGAVLSNSSSVANLIVSHYPKHIPAIMAALNELQNINADYPGSCDYLPDHITTAKITLLLQLKQKHSEHYTLTYTDKRLIEGHLFSEINSLPSTKSLHTFYQQHADGLYLNQQRHAGHDSIRQKPFPRIKENILIAMQNKSMSISHDTDLSNDEKETLDNKILNLKSILQAKRDSLLKQGSSLTFFLFYSSSRTNTKIQIIDESLEKLDTITYFSELRIFTENLLLNDALTARRSLGITSSDTYQKLKQFYDDCFFVSNICLNYNNINSIT